MNQSVDRSDRWREFFLSLLDFIYPRRCVGCNKEGAWLCAKCQLTITKIQTPTCFFCQTITKGGKTCPTCRAHHALTGVIVYGYHEGVLKDAVHALKYDFIQELADPLGGLLASTLVRLTPFAHNLRSLQVEYPAHSTSSGHSERQSKSERSRRRAEGPVIIPIPLHRKRLAQRGFNQSELLARAVARRLGLAVDTGLVRIKNVVPQVDLSGIARRKNMTGAFVWKGKSLKGKTVLLIDDVATTGTTLDEATRVLRSAGARIVWGAVITKG